MIRLRSHDFPVATLLLAALSAACLGLLALFGFHLYYPALAAGLLHSVFGDIAIAFATLFLLARFSFSARASPILARRVLVLGVGPDAAMVKEALDHATVRSLLVVGFYSIDADQPVDAALPASGILPPSKSIMEITRLHNVSEIIIALPNRRGATLPLTDLLNAKLQGVKVTDLPSFFEQYQGKVRIDLLRESWFIFGSGFRQCGLRMFVKRTFDIVSSSALLVVSLSCIMTLAAFFTAQWLSGLNGPGAATSAPLGRTQVLDTQADTLTPHDQGIAISTRPLAQLSWQMSQLSAASPPAPSGS